MIIGLTKAKCTSSAATGCRRGAFFQRTPPEPPSIEARDSSDASFNLEEFWNYAALTAGRPGEWVTVRICNV